MKRWLPAMLALAVISAGCGSHEKEKTGDTRPPVDVTALTPGTGASRAVLTLAGRVKAVEEVTVASRLASRLTALPFREGQSFRKGQPLALFDAPEMKQALSSAESAVASALAARDKARIQEARVDSLKQTGVASDRQQELAVLDRRAAEAQYAQAEATLAGLRESISISVPFDGVVVRRHADPGAPLNPGQPILDVRSNAVGEIVVPFPESELDRLTTDRIQFKTDTSGWIDATVLRVDGMTDFASRTRTAHLAPAETADLEPGAFARVRVTPPDGAADADGNAAGMTVPEESLVRRGTLAGVYVLDGDRARLRWLRVGREEAGQVQVLAGLDAGELFAANPSGLEDGRLVRAGR